MILALFISNFKKLLTSHSSEAIFVVEEKVNLLTKKFITIINKMKVNIITTIFR